MALIKKYETENGSTGEYWRIKDIIIETVLECGIINYGLIKDKGFRDEHWDKLEPEHREKLFIYNSNVAVRGEEYLEALQAMDSGSEKLRAYSYNLLKVKDENLSDAIDG